MKTITHQALLDPCIRPCIDGGGFRQRPVEGRVEDRELRDTFAQGFPTSPDAFQVGRIVQRREFAQPVDGRLDLRCNERRPC